MLDAGAIAGASVLDFCRHRPGRGRTVAAPDRRRTTARRSLFGKGGVVASKAIGLSLCSSTRRSRGASSTCPLTRRSRSQAEALRRSETRCPRAARSCSCERRKLIGGRSTTSRAGEHGPLFQRDGTLSVEVRDQVRVSAGGTNKAKLIFDEGIQRSRLRPLQPSHVGLDADDGDSGTRQTLSGRDLNAVRGDPEELAAASRERRRSEGE